MLKKVGEKNVCQLLGFMHGMRASAGVGVKRAMGLTKRRQRRSRVLRVRLAFAGSQNHAPLRSGECVDLPPGRRQERLHGLI